MNIGLFGKRNAEEEQSYLQDLVSGLEKENSTIWIHHSFYSFIKDHVNFQKPPVIFSDTENLSGKIDFLLSLGGDGTLLRTISLVRDSNIPILGINTGHLGFLTTIGTDKIPDFIRHLLTKQYSIETRSLLKIESSPDLFDGYNFALNELSVHSKDSFSLLTTDVFVNNKHLATYVADGLIVATPTGSTAYSLSCGGPILSPDSNSFVITPIAAHTLTLRPIIIPDTSVITLRFNKNSDAVYACLDSRRQLIDKNIELTLKKERFNISLVRMYGQDFFSTICEKLMWGAKNKSQKN